VSILPRKPRARTTEFRTVKRIDNSRRVRILQPARMRDLARMAALWFAFAGMFLLYGYQRFHCIELSFQLEDLKAKQAQAGALNSELKLEVAGLRNPMRIDIIAHKQLGLTEPLPNQFERAYAPSGAEVAAVSRVRAARPQ
jgi:cell division protein FtsB